MKKVYVAGPYSADNVIDVLKNIGNGQKKCAELFEYGFAPFCPWHDKDFIINNPYKNFDVKQFYEYSITWLKVCDAMLLIEGWEKSKGCLKEIEIANEMNIPIFYNIYDIIKWYISK